MEKVTVCTACLYDSRDRVNLLDMSCNLLGIKLEVYGLGCTYRGNLDAKIIRLRRFVGGRRGIVLFMDGVDGFVVRPLEYILDCYYKAIQNRVPLVMGTETGFWPMHPWLMEHMGKIVREVMKSRGPLRSPYLNSGFIIGDARYLASCLDTIIRSLPEYEEKIVKPSHTLSDQGAWMFNLIRGNVDLVCDYDCQFQIACGDWARSAYNVDSTGITMLDTGVRPAYIHGNGWRGRQRLEEFVNIVEVAGVKDWSTYQIDRGRYKRKKPWDVLRTFVPKPAASGLGAIAPSPYNDHVE
jgi:hypothetical protein